MGFERESGRPEGEQVYRMIAHAASLNREAARAFDAGRAEEGVAFLEQAELLSDDVTGWVDEIEALQTGERRGDAEMSRFRGPIERLKHLGAGLSAGLAFGCAMSEV